jgi:signal transduction histidine kinase
MLEKPSQQDITIVLAEVASAVVGQFEMATLLNQIIETTMKTLHAEVCSIFLEDKQENPGILTCVAGSGFAKNIPNIAKYRIGEGFTGTVAKLGKEFNITSRENLENLEVNGERVWKGKHDENQWPSGVSEFRNCIALPLKIKEQILGVIKVENKDKRFGNVFTEEDLVVFKTVANVTALTIENARLHMQIEKQLKTIASKAAHRINNQVASYDGIELDLKEEAESPVPDKHHLMILLDRLSNTTKNLKLMINDFKNYGKPIILNKSISDINKIISDEIWHSKPPENIIIKNDLDKNIPMFGFDAGRFAESIKELLNNSIRILKEHEQAGCIFITTRLTEAEGTVGKSVMIKIEDDGPGFHSEFPVFSPFHSTDPQRTGLGLATVKEMIEAHRGTIQQISSAEHGAHFRIFIPI